MDMTKYIGQGKECTFYGVACCDELECLTSGKKSLYSYTTSCELMAMTLTTTAITTTTQTTETTATNCVEGGEKCNENELCCEYAECKKGDSGDSSSCLAKSSK